MKQQKEKVKTHVDKPRKEKGTNLKVGDTVLVRQSKKNKFSTSCEPPTSQARLSTSASLPNTLQQRPWFRLVT
jgi:hypothetical protein